MLSKAILECVNSAVKECENLQRLAEMQKRIDRRPLENVSNNQIVSEYKVGTGLKLIYIYLYICIYIYIYVYIQYMLCAATLF